jgi:hypothetical protein
MVTLGLSSFLGKLEVSPEEPSFVVLDLFKGGGPSYLDSSLLKCWLVDYGTILFGKSLE